VQEASTDVIQGVIIRLGFLFGHVIEKARAQQLSVSMEKARWTMAELEKAEWLIPNDEQLARQVGFDRTIAPAVFTMARERREILRCRLLENQEARKYCTKKYLRLNVVFSVVHVENVTSPNGRLKPFWLMK